MEYRLGCPVQADSAEAQQNLKEEGLITTEEDAAKRAEILEDI